MRIRRVNLVLFSWVILGGLLGRAAASEPDHARWDSLLKQYVTPEFRVDYRGLKDNGRQELDTYLADLAAPWTAGMPPAATKAALINAYNALTVRWIVSNYPAESIWRTDDPFQAARHTVNGERISLDGIETRLREMDDPRIHAALVCAARSCPPLRREAYRADRIDEQLDDNARAWLADDRLHEFDPGRKIAHASAILKWYEGDFDSAGGVREFLAAFAPQGGGAFLLEPEARVEYKTYLWGLNDSSPRGSGYSQVNFYWDWARNGYLFGKIREWFFGLGREYGVNPIIFGSIYLGAIPFFSLSVAWLIRNLRRRRPPLLPALCAASCFVSAYVYLLIAGKNIPAWVYLFLAGIVALGVHSTIRKIRTKLQQGGKA